MDVLTDVMRFVIPVVIKSYIPPEFYLKSHHDIFELLLEILSSGIITDKSTQHLVFDALLTSARNEDHIALLVNWFKDEVVSDAKGTKLESVDISKKHKHTIVQRIWSSDQIPLEQKEEIMKELAKIDTSDWLDNTKKVCESSHPGNKQKMWDLYFSEDPEAETKDWGLINFQNSFRGWNQVQHAKYTEPLQDQFFSKIRKITETKGRYVAESYFIFLKPTLKTDEAARKKYEDLLAEIEKETPDNTMLIKFLKNTITDLKVSDEGINKSREFLAS